ncbi:MAG: mechanosensitive ion channel family protein [Candidatus Ratteibacteria bacterium]
MTGERLGVLNELISKFWFSLSKVIGALLIFLIGWLIAKFLKLLIIKFFKYIKVDKLSEDSGLKELLEKGNITLEISQLLGIGVYWLLMLAVVFLSINFAGIQIPSNIIDKILSFIPKFILGLLIFIFSIFLGSFFEGIVRTSAGNAGIEKAPFLGKLTKIAIIIFGTVLALQEIGIAADFIGDVFIIVLASFCFGIALAFALGTKDIIKEKVEEFLKKK